MYKIQYYQYTENKPLDLPSVNDLDIENYVSVTVHNYRAGGHRVIESKWPNGNITIEVYAEARLTCRYMIIKMGGYED